MSTPNSHEARLKARQSRRKSPQQRLTRRILIGAVAVAIVATAVWGAPLIVSRWQCRAAETSAIVPTDGVLFGVNLDWSAESLAQYQQSLGHAPAVAAQFTTFPYTDQSWGWITEAADQTRSVGGVLLLTLEPNDGLDAVTDQAVNRLASDLHTINNQGTPVVLRFAHEMNGSWYAWSQQPTKYIAAFRKVAAAVHQQAPGTALMWAPNYGGGYPFAGGKYMAVRGTADFALLDTNGDKVLTMKDDPYLPYYPGDDAVDWVGMSLYHWGNHYPWGSNDLPEAGKLAAMLTGTYSGSIGNETAVPDFYQVYGAEHQRPVAITETAALYAPGHGGAGELALKQAWWRQAFASEIPTRFPMVKMINWFEWNKQEVEVHGIVDWRALGTSTTQGAFVADLPSWLKFGGDIKDCTWGFS